MEHSNLLANYNYDEFTPEKVLPWLKFRESPSLGQTGPDFPLWALEDGSETRLSHLWRQHLFTIVEFGSFT